MIKAVVLDLDGTLLYTLPDLADAINAALAEHDFPTWEVEAYRQFVGSGIRTAIRRATRPDLEPEILAEILETYQAIYPNHCTDRTEYYPGIREALAALRARGLRLGVFTNKTEETALRIVKHYFPEVPFEFIWGSNDVRPIKPDPTGGEDFCRLMGLRPEEVAFVGDSDVDILFARNAGLLPVGAAWGFRGREELEAAGATLLAETPADLPGLI